MKRVGNENPHTDVAQRTWNGHHVLMLPGLGRMIDPTIAQADTAHLQQPLSAAIPATTSVAWPITIMIPNGPNKPVTVEYTPIETDTSDWTLLVTDDVDEMLDEQARLLANELADVLESEVRKLGRQDVASRMGPELAALRHLDEP